MALLQYTPPSTSPQTRVIHLADLPPYHPYLAGIPNPTEPSNPMGALEDNFEDIIGKAQEGLHFSDQTLANKAQISLERLESLKSGKVDSNALWNIAEALALSPHALEEIAANKWVPSEIEAIPGFERFESPCGTGVVNAYLAWDQFTGNAVLFDTGTEAGPIVRFVLQHKLRLQMVLLTHSHSDHVAALPSILSLTDSRAFIDKLEAIDEAETFQAGHNFRAGSLEIESRATPGHSRGGVTYVISGLARRVAIVGDSLFAGSIGRGFYSYGRALRSNCQKILTLPGDTVICPGHGPVTTVAEEQLHNPFFALRFAASERAREAA